MTEIYEIVMEQGRLDFRQSEKKYPEREFFEGQTAQLLTLGWKGFCVFGDPELLSCRVYRHVDQSGAVFVMSAGEPLFMAHTDSNLTFSQACGHFAKLVCDSRYAEDIWKETEDEE